eukprot:m.211702 g.211702  ORF g.211702 m.211702 type:complete len:346 (-) comp33107_c0_seq2:499-1536(-)
MSKHLGCDLVIEVLSGEDLVAKDKGAFGRGKSDPYVRVMVDGKVISKTATVKKNLSPEWQGHRVATRISPNTSQEIKFMILDWDLGGESTDDFMGEVNVDVTQLEPNARSVLVRSVEPTDGCRVSGTLKVAITYTPEKEKEISDLFVLRATNTIHTMEWLFTNGHSAKDCEKVSDVALATREEITTDLHSLTSVSQSLQAVIANVGQVRESLMCEKDNALGNIEVEMGNALQKVTQAFRQRQTAIEQALTNRYSECDVVLSGQLQEVTQRLQAVATVVSKGKQFLSQSDTNMIEHRNEIHTLLQTEFKTASQCSLEPKINTKTFPAFTIATDKVTAEIQNLWRIA